MDKRSILAIALIVGIAGGGLYYMHASYERRLAEAQAMVNNAQVAAKRAQEVLKKQQAADAAKRR